MALPKDLLDLLWRLLFGDHYDNETDEPRALVVLGCMDAQPIAHWSVRNVSRQDLVGMACTAVLGLCTRMGSDMLLDIVNVLSHAWTEWQCREDEKADRAEEEAWDDDEDEAGGDRYGSAA